MKKVYAFHYLGAEVKDHDPIVLVFDKNKNGSITGINLNYISEKARPKLMKIFNSSKSGKEFYEVASKKIPEICKYVRKYNPKKMRK